MKMVAAAKLRRAQTALLASRPYSRKISDLIKHLASNVDLSENVFVKEREVRKVAIIVVTVDRGFCGAFNSNIIKATQEHIHSNYAESFAEGNVKLFVIGKKGFDFFSKRKFDVVKGYPGVFHDLKFSAARDLASEVTKGYLDGLYDKVDVIYNEFKNILQQRLAIEQFLPIPKEVVKQEENQFELEYIYEPDLPTILEALMPRHLQYQIWRVLLESNAASEGARMAAMDNASENASELIQTLSLHYNKARQAAITKELLEVVSGAEALTASG